MAERPLGGGEGYRTTGPFGGEERINRYESADRVRWGPILAGVFVALSVSALLGLIGLAVHAAIWDPAQPAGEAAGWGWTIWGIVVLLLSFGAGGWIAARSSAIGSQQNGLLNGAMVWAVAVPVMFWVLTGTFGAIMGPAAMMAQAMPDQEVEQIFAMPAEGQEQQPQQQQQQQPVDPQQAQEAMNLAAWGTVIALLLGLGAAAAGGFLGGKADEPQDRDRYRGRREPDRGPDVDTGPSTHTTTTRSTPPPSEP
ncbi:MAG: hypothetical protein WD294_00780 [Phycisphaeraceae bacterium]